MPITWQSSWGLKREQKTNTQLILGVSFLLWDLLQMLIAVDTVQPCLDTSNFRVIALAWSLFDRVTSYLIAIALKPFLKYILLNHHFLAVGQSGNEWCKLLLHEGIFLSFYVFLFRIIKAITSHFPQSIWHVKGSFYIFGNSYSVGFW